MTRTLYRYDIINIYNRYVVLLLIRDVCTAVVFCQELSVAFLETTAAAAGSSSYWGIGVRIHCGRVHTSTNEDYAAVIGWEYKCTNLPRSSANLGRLLLLSLYEYCSTTCCSAMLSGRWLFMDVPCAKT